LREREREKSGEKESEKYNNKQTPAALTNPSTWPSNRSTACLYFLQENLVVWFPMCFDMKKKKWENFCCDTKREKEKLSPKKEDAIQEKLLKKNIYWQT